MMHSRILKTIESKVRTSYYRFYKEIPFYLTHGIIIIRPWEQHLPACQAILHPLRHQGLVVTQPITTHAT